MKRLDQGHLHPLLEHTAGNKTRVTYEPGVHSSKELFEQLIRNLYSTGTYLFLDKKKKLCMSGLGSFQLDPVFYAPDGQVRLAFSFHPS
jgi:hypothetical protein